MAKLTEGQVRALRILAAHDWAREDQATDETVPCVSFAVTKRLYEQWLVECEWRDGYLFWRIRAKGRQALREHANGSAS